MLLSKLECPHCHESWTEDSEKVAHGASVNCQSCSQIFSYKKNIIFNDPVPDPPRPNSFIHDMDKEALDTLKAVKGLDTALKVMMKHSYEK